MRKFVLLLLVLELAIPLLAQSNYGVISGSLTDAQHLAIADAEVRITSVATGAVRRVTTQQAGLFEVPALFPGEYVLETSVTGFASTSQRVRLEVGQKLELDVSLKVGPVEQGVNVVGNAQVMKTTDASVGEVIEPKSIRELPLNGRMLIDLVLTVPGAHIGFGAQTGQTNPLYWRPGQRSAVVIGGSRSNANYFLLDGATNTDPTFNTQNLSPSPDAVREFQVETSSYTADMGGAGGGQINIVSNSGSSKFHGTAYEFLRNGAMDASTFGSMGNNHLVQNNFGGSLGGPVPHSKNTFFFANYEGLRLAQSDAQTLTVPTMDEIMGDFSMSGTKIYDPTTAVANPAYNPALPTGPSNYPYTRSQFAGNQIPAGRINTQLQDFLMKYVPMPNMSMMGVAGTDSNNYLDIRNETHFQDQGTVRIDHNFSGGDTLFARYSIGRERGFSPSSGSTATTQNLPGFGADFDNQSQQSVISWNHLFATNKVNTAALAFSRLAMDRSSQNDGVNDIVSELGIQGVGFGGQGAWGAPWFAVQGYTGIGDTFAATPMKAWDTMYELRDSYAWDHGKHSIKFGGDLHVYRWPMWGFFQNRGYYQFTNGYTTDHGFNDGSGSALAALLLSLPAVKQRQAGVPQMDLANWGSSLFVEDSWRVNSTTTLNAGLRYEYSSPLYDKDNTNTNLIFDDNRVPSVFVGGQNGYPKGLMYANKKNFAPRIGLAKNIPHLGLVVHTSYGIFFTPVDQNTWCNQRHNVPYVFPETQQADNFTPPAALFNTGLNFGTPVLGTGALPATTVSFTAFDPHAPSQYVQQWNASVQKSLGKDTSVEIGYLGSRGYHLQRAHLINNPTPGPGPLGPRRPFKTLTFVPDTTLPEGSTNAIIQGQTFPVSTINLLENTAQSWYDAGYINIRRRYSHGLSFLANYTYAKNLTNAPDFRGAMDEATIPQDNRNLDAENGLGCDVRHRFALSTVYDIPMLQFSGLRAVTRDWHMSAVYQVQSGMPFTISVFGDTANAGTVLGENPVRANYTGAPIFGPGTHTSEQWFNPAAFSTPAAFTFGNVGRNSLYGPGLQTLDLALSRNFKVAERGNFELRAEAFNALNKTNLGTPNRFVNTPQFGTITMAMTPGRQIQIGARLSF
jgi:hypothetical protein